MAVALAVFSSLISQHILSTTYIMGGGYGLHDLLLEKAWEDDKAASLCRALLLSLFSPQRQSKKMDAAMKAVEDDFYSFARRLLSSDQYGEYVADLTSLLRRVIDLWQGAQRSTIMFDAGLSVTEPKIWTGFGSSAPTLPPDTTKDQTAGTVVSGMDVVLVLFPGFVRIWTESEHIVFPCMVLTKSQMTRINEELNVERHEAMTGTRRKPSTRRRDSVGQANFLGSSP